MSDHDQRMLLRLKSSESYCFTLVKRIKHSIIYFLIQYTTSFWAVKICFPDKLIDGLRIILNFANKLCQLDRMTYFHFYLRSISLILKQLHAINKYMCVDWCIWCNQYYHKTLFISPEEMKLFTFCWSIHIFKVLSILNLLSLLQKFVLCYFGINFYCLTILIQKIILTDMRIALFLFSWFYDRIM